VSNRSISQFPIINGGEINEQDLMTLVHVFEVDPVLRNKKITFTEFKNYLNLYYVQQKTSGVTLNGLVVYDQSTPSAVDVTATLTVDDLKTKIITSSTSSAVFMSLPTGVSMDSGFTDPYNDMAFEWTVINTGATNSATVQSNTNNTLVGTGVVSANNSGRFSSRRTSTNNWITYRLAS